MDSERLEELLERGEQNTVEQNAITTLRRRFEPITYEAEDILRAAMNLGIPEETAMEECLTILTDQLKQAIDAKIRADVFLTFHKHISLETL